jgi:hypothetical protein
VATISSGPSRLPNYLGTVLRLLSAVAVAAAAALIFFARPFERPPPEKSSPSIATSQPAHPDSVFAATLALAQARGQRADSATIEESLANADPRLRDLILERTLPALVDEDAQAAARLAERQHEPYLREAAERIVAARWAEVAPEDASHWAISLANEGERDQAIEHVALALAGTNPRGALGLLERRSRGAQPDAATAGVIASWAGVDFDAALAWVEAQPQSPALDEILQRLVFLKAGTDPVAATRLADRMVGDERARSEVFASIAQVWAARDPDGVREWAASLDTNVRHRLERELSAFD